MVGAAEYVDEFEPILAYDDAVDLRDPGRASGTEFHIFELIEGTNDTR